MRFSTTRGVASLIVSGLIETSTFLIFPQISVISYFSLNFPYFCPHFGSPSREDPGCLVLFRPLRFNSGLYVYTQMPRHRGTVRTCKLC